MHADQHFVCPDQLCLGLYVHLDMPWMDHPFTFSSFLIKTEQQLQALRKLGLSRIRYEPAKSTCIPAAVSPAPQPETERAAEQKAEAQVDQPAEQADAEQARARAKRAQMEHLQRIKRQISAVEAQFQRAAESMRNITNKISTQPVEARREGTRLVNEIVDTVFGKTDVTLHAISEKMGDDTYFHPLNVTVLALILGRALGLDSAALREVGLGALFHDIGKHELPRSLLAKPEPLMPADIALLERHCAAGFALAQRMGLSEVSRQVILQHHEYLDGSGYPAKLVGEAIGPLVRIVVIANTYDNLCNPRNAAQALTPSEALSRMFATMRHKLDQLQLQMFIRCLGVYPPGSIVQLSNDMIGLVLSTSSKQPLRPNVLVYDPNVPKENSQILCLEQEPDLKITKSIRPAQLPRDIYQYLNPRKRVAYYFDPQPHTGVES
jgi:putative nucleotidyltransferase with HDIG domain